MQIEQATGKRGYAPGMGGEGGAEQDPAPRTYRGFREHTEPVFRSTAFSGCVVESNRLRELLQAMNRYVEAGMAVPDERMKERYDLLARYENNLCYKKVHTRKVDPLLKGCMVSSQNECWLLGHESQE